MPMHVIWYAHKHMMCYCSHGPAEEYGNRNILSKYNISVKINTDVSFLSKLIV